MNRIYQGRVQKITRPINAEAQETVAFAGGRGGEDQSTCPLWQHHEVFQDAINYYLVSLAALAGEPPEGEEWRVMRDIRSRVGAAWECFPREDAARAGAKSLRASLSRWLNLAPEAGVQDALDAVMRGCEGGAAARLHALALVLEKCAGDSAIQQGGRAYLPRLCWAGYEGSFDYSSEALASASGKDQLAVVLHGEPTLEDLRVIAAEMELSWTVKIQPGEYFEGEAAKERVREALDYLAENALKSPSPRVSELLSGVPDPLAQVAAMRKAVDRLPEAMQRIPRNRKAAKDLTFATIAFKIFPCELTRQLLRACVKAPGKSKKTKAGAFDFTAAGDDPVRIARGQRGYVFPAFTALPTWNPQGPGEPVWKEFDIAAFKEALKSLNQFNQKTLEREAKQQELRGTIAHLLGKPLPGWAPPKNEAGEDTELPDSLDPQLLALALQLENQLTESLSEAVVGEGRVLHFGDAELPVREGGWTITRASLRGLRDISADWNKLLRSKGPDIDPKELEKVVHDYQRDEAKSRAIGSVPMLLALCAREFHPLWAEVVGDDAEEQDGASQRFLARVAQLHELVQEFGRTQEPINLTPAEPRHSRRLAMLSDLSGRSAARRVGPQATEVSVAALDSEGKFSELRIVLHYSAPRLHRDHLVGGTESRWLQPMVEALGVPMPATSDEFDPAVSLMPDFDEHGDLRYLLNFVANIDTATLHEALGKAARWKGNFNGVKEKNLHLHWPGTLQREIKGGEGQWWSNPAVLEHGFTVLATDLGQRSAGAWALLRITAGEPHTKRPVRSIGHDGSREWFAEISASGLLRLPGEDAAVRGAGGTMQQELSGKTGRMASESEWLESKELAARLLAADPAQWVGARRAEKSFPEQNDALIALANRRLSRLATFHRWSCFDPEKPEVASRREAMVRGLLAELEHWQDPEVAQSKQHLEAGNFTAFRDAAGATFARYRAELQPVLEKLADRVCPLRGWRWVWKRRGGPSPYGDLVWEECEVKVKVRGQRGLSMARLEQLGSLRRLFLRYNRSLDRQPGEPAKFGRADAGRQSGEPCSLLLAKIDRMKEQRIDQTAHLILAQALGVRLREHHGDAIERATSDRHGEYEVIRGRAPVDFIVIENLDRYLTSQGRAPSENSRLMQWSHRAVRDKIKMLAEEPFGIPIVEVSAAYSSRFCAVTGEAGTRCEERASLDPFLREQFTKRAAAPVAAGQIDQRDHYRRLLEQFGAIERENSKRLAAKKPLRTLLLPKAGGPLFAGATAAGVRQADLNAASNLALRAVAAPEALHLIHKVRAAKDAESFVPKRANAREKAAFAANARIALIAEPSAKLAQSRSPNFFHDSAQIASFDRGTLRTGAAVHSVASGVGLWRGVNERFLARISAINDERLHRWHLTDDLPM
jgi:hypothetical protein